MTEFEKAAEAKMQASFGHYLVHLQVSTENVVNMTYLPAFTLIAASPEEAIKKVKQMYSMFPSVYLDGNVMRSMNSDGESCYDYYKEIEHIKV